MGARTSRIRSSTLLARDNHALPNEDIYSIPHRTNKNRKPPRPRLVDEEEFRKVICQSSIRGFLTRSRRAKQPRFNLNRQPQMTPNKKVEEWLQNADNVLADPPSAFEMPVVCTATGHLTAPESVILELLQRVRAEVQTIRETSSMTKKEELLEGMEEAILYDICYVERRLEERRSQRRSMRQPRLISKTS
ncbi:unnamed protein product [Auanema sp. JU1783]|nr:unnamed protein product [Auanema sp. JU1783]